MGARGWRRHGQDLPERFHRLVRAVRQPHPDQGRTEGLRDADP